MRSGPFLITIAQHRLHPGQQNTIVTIADPFAAALDSRRGIVVPRRVGERVPKWQDGRFCIEAVCSTRIDAESGLARGRRECAGVENRIRVKSCMDPGEMRSLTSVPGAY